MVAIGGELDYLLLDRDGFREIRDIACMFKSSVKRRSKVIQPQRHARVAIGGELDGPLHV